MGGSAAEAPTTPDAEPVARIRASDAERDEVLARLREEFVAGRLSHNTFLIRLDAVLQARHVCDLPPLLADLEPAAEPAPGPVVPQQSPAGPAWQELGTPGTVAPYPAGRPGRGPFPPAAQPSLAGRVRAALDRWFRPPASRRPLPLQFPRGSGTFFSIGRNVGCDLSIADMTVSRVHARLERTGEGWLLSDLGSTNGTRVNGWLVRQHVPVMAGDLVSFGKAEFWLTAAQGT
jgi:FHA domain/Domain of unknown function (DUF1707)